MTGSGKSPPYGIYYAGVFALIVLLIYLRLENVGLIKQLKVLLAGFLLVGAVEAAPIGGQPFAQDISRRDCTAFLLLFDTYDTRLLAQARSRHFLCGLARAEHAYDPDRRGALPTFRGGPFHERGPVRGLRGRPLQGDGTSGDGARGSRGSRRRHRREPPGRACRRTVQGLSETREQQACAGSLRRSAAPQVRGGLGGSPRWLYQGSYRAGKEYRRFALRCQHDTQVDR